MKNALWLFAPLPLVIGFAFWHNDAQPIRTKPVSTTVLPISNAKTPLPHHSHNASRNPSLSTPPHSVVEARRTRNEFISKEATMWTRELREAVANTAIKRTETEITPLLKKWGIDTVTAGEVMAVFRDFESESMNIYVMHLKNGLEGEPQRKREQEAEEKLAGYFLETLLGADRAAQLLKVRKDGLDRISAAGIEARLKSMNR